jgi:2-keto-4-pentenoate hydratase/2-oxohepta-3-ene-1,7-dioic acid hydratase in catechol pathway
MSAESFEIFPPSSTIGVRKISGRPDPVFLKAGDVMRLGCPQLGAQEQRVKPWKRT